MKSYIGNKIFELVNDDNSDDSSLDEDDESDDII